MAAKRRDPHDATVVKIIDDYTLVINRGSSDGVNEYNQFLIYVLDDSPILDPETGEDLGNLEIVKGSGDVLHLQEKLTTIRSNKYEKTGSVVRTYRSPRHYRTSALTALAYGVNRSDKEETVEEPEAKRVPFRFVEIGDKAKLVR